MVQIVSRDDADTVVVRTPEGKQLWSHELTGEPLIEYVPAQAFHMEETGEVTITVEKSGVSDGT